MLPLSFPLPLFFGESEEVFTVSELPCGELHVYINIDVRPVASFPFGLGSVASGKTGSASPKLASLSPSLAPALLALLLATSCTRAQALYVWRVASFWKNECLAEVEEAVGSGGAVDAKVLKDQRDWSGRSVSSQHMLLALFSLAVLSSPSSGGNAA